MTANDLPTTLRAVLPTGATRPDGVAADAIVLGDRPMPQPGPGEALLRIHASALNRADLLQMRGGYPPPPGESPVPGLECAGEILALGPDADPAWRVGQRVMALLAGGGHASHVAAPCGQLMPIPDALGWTQAAALPEAALTAWTNLVVEGDLRPGEHVLITAAASGIGTFATQLARELGAEVWVAGRSLVRLDALRALGASHALRLGEALPVEIRRANDGMGVDLVLDLVGGSGLAQHLAALRRGGRLVLIGLLGGARAEIDLADVLRRRLQLVGSVLRSRDRAEKAALVAGFWQRCGDALADGRLRPVIDTIYPFAQIADAFAHMREGGACGKLVIAMTPEALTEARES
ncbi:MAG: NAD(P)H-quinone oxidoreductase [Acidobacteriota bacterium]